MTRRNEVPRTRVQRRHLATVEEVKEIARERLVREGAATLSLRAIARDMGVVPSALYRYFPSHAHLLEALADDAATSMLEHVRMAGAVVPSTDHRGRWVAQLRAYRTWVMSHEPGYTLNFGPAPERHTEHPPDDVVRRIVGQLARTLQDANDDGTLDLLNHPIGEAIAVQVEIPGMLDVEVDPKVFSIALAAWTAIHGSVALEATGRLPLSDKAADDYFEAQLAGLTLAIGFDHQ